MERTNKKQTVLSRAAAFLLTAALAVTTFIPATAVSVDAAVDNGKPAVSTAEENVKNSEQIATVISNCKTSYNELQSAPLNITAFITPADGREVQLQRYNSADETWSTVMTANAAQEQKAEEKTEEKAEEKTETVNASGSQEAANASNASNTDDAAAVNVTFSVAAEERAKTNSQWRIYVPATEKAAEAYSETIKVTSQNLESPDLSARTACIYRIDGDGTGSLIYSKNADKQHAQASTTKLMTAILLLESGKINSTTRISKYAARTPYATGRLKAGDVYRNRDLLYAMLLPSSNDAATAVAEGIGGSEAGFVSMMNAKAEAMGLTNTHFRNAHGLDADGHYTTAHELAKLTAYAYTFPEIRECWATRYKTIKSVKWGRRWTCWSTNAIFSYIKNFLGGKTGTEGNAGCCFAGVYTYGGSTYVTVVLGSGYGFSRWSDTKKLHRYIEKYAATTY